MSCISLGRSGLGRSGRGVSRRPFYLCRTYERSGSKASGTSVTSTCVSSHLASWGPALSGEGRVGENEAARLQHAAPADAGDRLFGGVIVEEMLVPMMRSKRRFSGNRSCWGWLSTGVMCATTSGWRRRCDCSSLRTTRQERRARLRACRPDCRGFANSCGKSQRSRVPPVPGGVHQLNHVWRAGFCIATELEMTDERRDVERHTRRANRARRGAGGGANR